jgi:hypothetical protein
MHQTCKHAVYVLNTLHQRNHELSIICCSYFDLWRQRRKMRDVYRCSTLELNRMPILSSIVHHICRYALYVVMTLRLSNHHSHLNSAERRGRDMDKIKSSKETRSWTEICIYCACISVLCQQRGLFLWSPRLDPQNCLSAVGAGCCYKTPKSLLRLPSRFWAQVKPYTYRTSLFFFWFGIHTASVPSTAETHTGGGAVLGKPEGSPA